MAGRAARKIEAFPNQHWIEASLDKLHADLALFALAEMEMKDWCSQFGGPPHDSTELVALRCSFEPSAQKLLRSLLAMPADQRRALAYRILKNED